MLLIVLDVVVKASIVLAIAALAAMSLRRASAATRHFVWTLGLMGALAAPILALALPRWEIPLVRVQTAATIPAIGMSASDAPAMAAPALHPRSAAAASTPAEAASSAAGTEASVISVLQGLSPVTLLLGLWALGAAVIVARVLVGLAAVRWMSRRNPVLHDAPWLPLAESLAGELGLRRVRFLRSPTASMPMAWGIFRPAVLMPADADAWPSDRLRIVLLHELAHVKRRDCLTHLCAQIACAAYWFNPLAWVAARHVRTERERACDDLVLASGTRGPDYADQLLDIARVMRAGRFPAILAGASLAMAHRSQLEGRLMAILDPNVPRRGVGRAKGTLLATTFAVLVLPVAAIQPWAEAAAMKNANSGMAERLHIPGPPNAAPRFAQGAIVTPAPSPLPRPTPTTTTHAVTAAQAREAMHVAGAIAQAAADGVTQGVTQGMLDGTLSGLASALAPQNLADAVQEAVQGGADKPQAARSDRAVNALIEALKDSDKEVRETAMAALAHMHDPRAFDALVSSLTDQSADVRENAVFGLGQLRDTRAVAPLTAAIKDQNASVREQAAFALGQIRASSAVDALTAALRDASGDVREQAAFALGQIRQRSAVDPLTSALKDQDADVREQAAFALGQIRDPRAIDGLVVALKDQNASVREQVAFALGQIRDPRAVDGLTTALKDPSPSVRQQAAFALGQIRN